MFHARWVNHKMEGGCKYGSDESEEQMQYFGREDRARGELSGFGPQPRYSSLLF